MLANPVNVVEPIAKGLQRIVLMQGGKYYGRHLGAFKTPAKETDPRHLPPNFYYDQQDFLVRLQAGKSWTWAALRPEAVAGFAIANPLNLINLIAVYALICRELGLPLRFPGSAVSYHTLTQMTDAKLLARAQLWAATSPNCANEGYNVTNGDCYRWEQVWPGFAEFFGMKIAEPLKISLPTYMNDKGPIWDEIVRKNHLRPQPYGDVATWEFGDFVFHTDWDLILADGKRFRHGFTDTVDTEERFFELFEELRRENIIPKH